MKWYLLQTDPRSDFFFSLYLHSVLLLFLSSAIHVFLPPFSLQLTHKPDLISGSFFISFLYHHVAKFATKHCPLTTQALSPCVKPQSRGEETRTEDEVDQEIDVSLDARHQTQIQTGSWEQPVVPQDHEIALEKLSVSSFLLSVSL